METIQNNRKKTNYYEIQNEDTRTLRNSDIHFQMFF